MGWCATVDLRLVSVIPAVLVLSLLPSAVLAADVYASVVIDDQGQLRIRIKGGERSCQKDKATRLASANRTGHANARLWLWLAPFLPLFGLPFS